MWLTFLMERSNGISAINGSTAVLAARHISLPCMGKSLRFPPCPAPPVMSARRATMKPILTRTVPTSKQGSVQIGLGGRPLLSRALPRGGPTAAPSTPQCDGGANPDPDGLQLLLPQLSVAKKDERAPQTFRWIRLHALHPAWVPVDCPAWDVLQVLTGIAEQAGGIDGPDRLHGHDVTACREGKVWWLSFG